MKNTPAPLLWRYLPLHLAVWAIGLVWFGLRGRGASFVRAKWDGVRGLPAAWRARRRVQASRVLTSAQVLSLLDRSSLLQRMRRP
ncbi:MAG: hypothetical protein R2712_18855 [Vicinamibacterales bacterium]